MGPMIEDGTTGWPDGDFIGYCELHCKTERALFHRDHIKRMAQLAGDAALLDVVDTLAEWITAHEDAMLPLVEKARARLSAGNAAQT